MSHRVLAEVDHMYGDIATLVTLFNRHTIPRVGGSLELKPGDELDGEFQYFAGYVLEFDAEKRLPTLRLSLTKELLDALQIYNARLSELAGARFAFTTTGVQHLEVNLPLLSLEKQTFALQVLLGSWRFQRLQTLKVIGAPVGGHVSSATITREITAGLQETNYHCRLWERMPAIEYYG